MRYATAERTGICGAIGLLGVLILSSCGTKPDLPELGQVTGVVTLDDQPLAGANVTFIPTNSRPCVGATDAEGRYTLYFNSETTGAPLGTHSVQISKMGEDGDTTELIPASYNSNTKLSAAVVAGDNHHDFKLKSQPSP